MPAALLILLAIAGALYMASASGDTDSPHHPFRSAEAKDRYLAVYDSVAREWPVPAETTSVRTSYGTTFVRISGPDSAPPLVLLHGAGGSALQWRWNIAAWSEDYRTYAVDVISDNGRSVSSRDPREAEEFVAWLNETFDALGLGVEIHLVGLSYGGWIAAQYAVHKPERLQSVALLAPAGTVQPLSFGWIRRAAMCALPARRFTRGFLHWLLEDLAQNQENRELLEREIDVAYLAIQSYKLRRMVNPSILSDSELAGLAVPTLFIIGENEKIYPAQAAVERLTRVAPQIHTEVIPGAGHDLTIVQANLVNHTVLEFLKH